MRYHPTPLICQGTAPTCSTYDENRTACNSVVGCNYGRCEYRELACLSFSSYSCESGCAWDYYRERCERITGGCNRTRVPALVTQSVETLTPLTLFSSSENEHEWYADIAVSDTGGLSAFTSLADGEADVRIEPLVIHECRPGRLALCYGDHMRRFPFVVWLACAGCNMGGTEEPGAPPRETAGPAAPASPPASVDAEPGEDAPAEARSAQVTGAEAAAADVALAELPDAPLRFVKRDFDLVVTDGRRSLVLPHPVSRIVRTETHGDRVQLWLEWEGMCGEHGFQQEYGVRWLYAALEHDAARKHSRAGRRDEALAGFQRAVAIGPSHREARIDLVRALNRMGRPDDALNALAPLIQEEPVLAYYTVLADAELEGLAEHPSLTALRVAASPTRPGAIVVHEDESEEGLWQWTAFSLRYGLVATTRRETSWGSSNYWVGAEFRDLSTGDLRFEEVLVRGSDTDENGDVLPARRRALEQRERAYTRTLHDLGFTGPNAEDIAEGAHNERGTFHVPFPRHRVSLVFGDQSARALRGDTVLGSVSLGGGLMALPGLEWNWGLDRVTQRGRRSAA